MLILQVSLYFNSCGCDLVTISFFGEMQTTTRSLAASALNNMVILVASNIVAAYRHPASLVIIRSRVETLLLTEREWTLLCAMDRNAIDVCKKSNDELRKELKVLTVGSRSSMFELFTGKRSASSPNQPHLVSNDAIARPSSRSDELAYTPNPLNFSKYPSVPPNTSGNINPVASPLSFNAPLPLFPASILEDDYRSKTLYCTEVIRCYQAELDELLSSSLSGKSSKLPLSAACEIRSSLVANSSITGSDAEKEEEQGSLPVREERTNGALRAAFSTTRYDSDDNIGRAIFGNRFKINLFLLVLLSCTALVGVTVEMFLYVRVTLPLHFSSSSHAVVLLLPVPLGVYCFLLINRELAVKILQERDTRIYLFWCAVFCTCTVAEVHKMGFLFSVQATFVSLVLALVPFVDAGPPKLRVILNKFASPIVVFFMLLMQVSFFFNWCGCELYTISFLGELKTTTRSLASTALNNLIIIAVSNVLAAFRHPSSLVMIRSRVEMLLLTETEATLLRAIDRNAIDVSKKSNDELKSELALLSAKTKSSVVGWFCSRKAPKSVTAEISTL